jgi:hypothetical protein
MNRGLFGEKIRKERLTRKRQQAMRICLLETAKNFNGDLRKNLQDIAKFGTLEDVKEFQYRADEILAGKALANGWPC